MREIEQPEDFWAKAQINLIENCNRVNVVMDQILAQFNKVIMDFGTLYFVALAVLVLFAAWPRKKKTVKAVGLNLAFLKELRQRSGESNEGIGRGVRGAEDGIGREVDKLNQKINLFKESITAFQSEVFDSHLEIWKELESSG